ncbi:MAG: hypothetical protein Q9213_002755 [Squamulea squamosa]
MAYGIMGSTRNSFMSTYQTTQPARCLYFDGASGSLVENNTMDTQNLLLYGNITGPPGNHSSATQFFWDEYARAQHLCAWLRQYEFDMPGQGIEGIVRMSAGFELIWCNFSSPSIRLVSRFNVSVPLLGYNRTSLLRSPEVSRQKIVEIYQGGRNDYDFPAPDWDIDWEHEPFVASQQWDWFASTSRTYSSEDLASNRVPSIRLLDADLVSLYSPGYQKHLVEMIQHDREHLNLALDGFYLGDGSQRSRRDAMRQLMRRRRRHRVGNISPQEVTKLRLDMKRMVSRLIGKGPYDDLWRDISWSHTCDMIVNNFAKRLLQLQRLLERGIVHEHGSLVITQRHLAILRERAHALMMPYFEYSSNLQTASETLKQQQQHGNFQVSFDRCRSGYLPLPVQDGLHAAGPTESSNHHFVGQAIEEVMGNICSVVIGVAVTIEKIWLQDFNQDVQKPDPSQQKLLRDQLRTMHGRVEELTAWLGWAPHWMSCDRLCAWDEECYIPIAPLLRQMSAERPAYGNDPVDFGEVEYDFWHPRCLKVTDFPTGNEW